MKTCLQCGASLTDDATMCFACGEPQQVEEAPSYVPPVYDPVEKERVFVEVEKSTGKAVSTMGWIGRGLINCIPLVGPLVYFIMLFVWSFGKKFEVSSRTWARAQLIMYVIMLVWSVVVTALLFVFAIFVLPTIGVAFTTMIASLFGIPSYVFSGLFDMSTLESIFTAVGLGGLVR